MPRRPFRVGRSLTGLGLFATHEIPKRVRIAEYKGPLLNAEEAIRAAAYSKREEERRNRLRRKGA